MTHPPEWVPTLSWSGHRVTCRVAHIWVLLGATKKEGTPKPRHKQPCQGLLDAGTVVMQAVLLGYLVTSRSM